MTDAITYLERNLAREHAILTSLEADAVRVRDRVNRRSFEKLAQTKRLRLKRRLIATENKVMLQHGRIEQIRTEIAKLKGKQ